jgi:hypothetical protein
MFARLRKRFRLSISWSNLCLLNFSEDGKSKKVYKSNRCNFIYLNTFGLLIALVAIKFFRRLKVKNMVFQFSISWSNLCLLNLSGDWKFINFISTFDLLKNTFDLLSFRRSNYYFNFWSPKKWQNNFWLCLALILQSLFNYIWTCN